MALFHVFNTVDNRRTGVPMAGVNVRAKFDGTDTIAPIYADQDGAAFNPANVCTTDADGMFSFYIDAGEYKLEFLVGSVVIKSVPDFRPAEVGPSGPANSSYATTAELESADTANVSAILAEVGKAGTFTTRNYADFTAEVAADTGKVNYIRSAFAPTKVWVRTSILSVAAGQIGASSGLTVDAELAAKATLTGVARTATHLGTFTGSTIPDNVSTKAALQAVESAVENTTGNAASKVNATAIGVAATDANMGTSPGAILSDNGTAKQWFQESEAAIEAAETAISEREIAAFSQSDSLTGSTVRKKLQQDVNPLDAPYSAFGDGTTNDRAALLNADASRPLTITGNHRLSSDLTFTRPVQFKGAGRLTIDAGVTVTFGAGITAPFHQIFYGDGGVAGLEKSWLDWFVGDAASTGTPSIECRAVVQRWLDSVVDNGELRSCPMHVLIDGSSALNVNKGQSFTGPGEWQLFFHWQGSVTNGFHFLSAGIDKPNFSGFQFRPNVPGTIPTAGTALNVRKSYTRLENFIVIDAYDALDNAATVVTYLSNYQIIGSRNSGKRLSGSVLDFHDDKFIIQALYDWVTLSGVSGTFNTGDAITLTGRSGQIVEKYSSTRYRIRFVGPIPTVGLVVTDTATGATGAISSITVGHDQGGVVILDNAEAVTMRAGDVLGGRKSLVTFTSGTAARSGFCYSTMESVYFDSSYEGSSMTGAYGNTIIDGWFASSANGGAKGLVLARSRNNTFLNPQFVNNADGGLSADSQCGGTVLICPICDGNCTLGGVAEIYVVGGIDGLQIIGGRGGYQGENGITPSKAIYLDAGASQNILVVGFDCPAGSVTNNATGAKQTWLGVNAVPVRFDIANFANAASDAAAAALGVPVGGLYRNGSAIMGRVA